MVTKKAYDHNRALQDIGAIRGQVNSLISGQAGYPVRSRTDSSVVSTGNVTTPTLFTAQYQIDGVLVAGYKYEITSEFNVTFGNQLLSFFVDINGTTTTGPVIGAAFGSNGDSLTGWIRFKLILTDTTHCKVSCEGGLVNLSLNAGHILAGTPGNAAALAMQPVGSVAIAAGNQIGIKADFFAGVVGQTVSGQGSDFVRKGPS